MKHVLYILPHQLFEPKLIPKNINEIVIWEHPDFFTKYNFNKKKLVLHRASMKYYKSSLEQKQSNKFTNVSYIEFHQKHSISTNKNIVHYMFDPINDVSNISGISEFLECPNFLVTKAFLQSIYDNKKGKDSISFTTYFYPRIKKEIDILVNVTSTDKSNRNKIDDYNPKDFYLLNNSTIKTKPFLEEAVTYVEEHFSKNYGRLDNDFVFPIDHLTAKKWMNHFIVNKLDRFGDYQDAILEEESYLFHSILSSSINIGLLNPSDIIDAIKPYINKYKMNNIEGYIRQLIWREYQRYCYIFLKSDFIKKNKYVLNVKMDKSWYSGNVGIHPLDVTIKKAFDTAYLHHIERLMIMGNMMMLHRIHKKDGFNWFMEFAIDSYEWLMYQNVYDMVFYSTGGKTTYKPYVSSSKYIIRMSNYKKDGEWDVKWDTLYKNFYKKMS